MPVGAVINNARPSERRHNADPIIHASIITGIRRMATWQQRAEIDVSSPHSPATTTRSNRGLELSPRVRLSKIVIRKPAPPIALSAA